MSSSLLLGSYVQEQQQSAHIQNETTSTSPLTYHFYKEHEHKFFEETSKYLSSISPTNQSKLKKCNCCPYGFHIDLDFIRYCEELAANGKRTSSKHLDRRNKRRQRKSLEVMLGFEDQWVLDYEKNLQPSSTEFQTVYEAFDDLEQTSAPPDPKEHSLSSKATKTLQTQQTGSLNDILSEVYSDFERTLERTSKRSRKNAKEGSCISGDSSYCSEKQLDHDAAQYTKKTPSASYTHESILIEEIHRAEHRSKEQKEVQTSHTLLDEATSLAKVNEIFSGENDRLSLVNRNLSDQLQSVRNQLSFNLNRVRDFEERVKLIPTLQLELSVEKAENRDMHLKLKALENVLKKREQNEKKAIETEEFTINTESIRQKPFNAQRVCATSLESLNIRFPSSSGPTEPQQSYKSVSCQIKTQPSTHNVGCMTTKSVMRDVGVVTIPVHVPTRNMAINTDINAFEEIHKKPIMKNVCVQSDREPEVEVKSVATVTDTEPILQIEKKSTGIMAVPHMKPNSCMVRPDVRSIGIDNIYPETKMRSFGTDPIKHIATDSSKPQDSPISLKLLDSIQTMPHITLEQHEVKSKAVQIPKEFRSMGTQHTPRLSDKYTQCKDDAIEPQPTAQTRTESTDTIDLTLHIHRGINTDAPAPKKDRLTNTDRIITDEKSTSTPIEKTNVKTSGTNTDPQEISVERKAEEKSVEYSQLSEHKCHNCLAKIEIKQRTIIKNPNKSQHVPNIASLSSSMDESYNDESLQQSDLQSRIPRPTALISPRSDKKFTRQNTYTISTQCPAEIYLSSCGSTAKRSAVQTTSTEIKTTTYRNRDDENKADTAAITDANTSGTNEPVLAGTSSERTTHNEDEEPKLWSHSMKSSSTYSSLASRPRQKVKPSKEMQAALKVINDSLLKGQHLATILKSANKIVQKEWFRISSTENAQPFEVEDYLDYVEEYSPDLLKYMVNLTDTNGNTAMHYAVSHGSFDIVSILLDSKVCIINNTNNAGYTCVMLVSLAKLDVAEHQTVVQRLFQMSDVNVRAKKHSQTALMLATSHGNYNMVRMLLDAGADINIQDEDGSTALMCAAEHGRMDIIKILLSQPDCDSTIQDLDGSTALKISLEAGYRDIGVLLYAHEYMIKNKSPYASLGNVGRKASTSSIALQAHVSNSNIAGTTSSTSEVVNSADGSKSK